MFHSEILSPWSFFTFWNGLPGIGRQKCVKMWFWQFSTHKIYVSVRGKLSEPHFDALFFSNPREKVWKAKKTMSHSFPCFSNLLPGIGEKQSIKVWFWEFSMHCDIYFVFGKLSEPHLTHSCLLIPGRPFQNARKLHGIRIWEWIISIYQSTSWRKKTFCSCLYGNSPVFRSFMR